MGYHQLFSSDELISGSFVWLFGIIALALALRNTYATSKHCRFLDEQYPGTDKQENLARTQKAFVCWTITAVTLCLKAYQASPCKDSVLKTLFTLFLLFLTAYSAGSIRKNADITNQT